MANKIVPNSIAGVELNPKATARTSKLLQSLDEAGAIGVAEPTLSMIDRFRVLASAYFTLLDRFNAESSAKIHAA